MKDFFDNQIASSKELYSKNILLIANCNGSCNWSKGVFGCAGTVEYNALAAFNSSYGLLIETTDATPAANDYCYGQFRMSVTETNITCLKLLAASPDWSKIKQLQIQIYPSNGTTQKICEILLDPQNSKITYKNSSGDYTELTDLATIFTNNCWYNIQIEFNHINLTYEKIIMSNKIVNMNSVGMAASGALATHEILLRLRTTNQDNAVSTAYFDNIIMFGKK